MSQFSDYAVILKDVTYSIMSELLQFMYQGEVNVKQAELQSFMSIAESLQIKGLATNSNSSNNGGTMKGTDPINSSSTTSSFSQFHSNNAGVQRNHHHQHQFNSGGNHTENHRQTTSTPLSTTSSSENHAMQASMKGREFSFHLLLPSSFLLKKIIAVCKSGFKFYKFSSPLKLIFGIN